MVTATASSAEEKVMLTIEDVASITQYSSRHVNSLIKAGKFPRPIRIGHRPRWIKKDLMAWIESGCPAISPARTIRGTATI